MHIPHCDCGHTKKGWIKSIQSCFQLDVRANRNVFQFKAGEQTVTLVTKQWLANTAQRIDLRQQSLCWWDTYHWGRKSRMYHFQDSWSFLAAKVEQSTTVQRSHMVYSLLYILYKESRHWGYRIFCKSVQRNRFCQYNITLKLLTRSFIWGTKLRPCRAAVVTSSISHGGREIILFQSAALGKKHISTGIHTAEIPNKMCLLQISPKACSQAGFEFGVTPFYTCSEQPSSPKKQHGTEDESTGPATPLPGGYSLSYTSINE